MIWDAYPRILLGIDLHYLFLRMFTCVQRCCWCDAGAMEYLQHGRCWEFNDCTVVHSTCCISAKMLQHTKMLVRISKKDYNIFSLTLLALYHRQAASSSTTAMSILHLLRDCIKRAAPTEDDNQSLQRHSDPSLQCRFFITKQLGYLHLTAVKS